MHDVAPGYVAVGRVVSASGVRGDLVIEPLSDAPPARSGPPRPLSPGRSVIVGGRTHTIERCPPQAGRLLRLKLSGIADREAAAALRDQYLLVPESDLEPLGEGQYYRFQLLGLAVRSTGGEPLGHVTDILSTPGNDVYVVQGPLGEILVPSLDDVVKEIDLEGRIITIEVVPGLLPPRPKT